MKKRWRIYIESNSLRTHVTIALRDEQEERLHNCKNPFASYIIKTFHTMMILIVLRKYTVMSYAQMILFVIIINI